MGMIDAAFAEQVTVERPHPDPDGNTTWTTVATLPAVVILAAPSAEAGLGPRYTQSGTVWLQRGNPAAAGDRITYQGHQYVLVGVPRGDRVHPMTGHDLGWCAWTLQGGEARWT